MSFNIVSRSSWSIVFSSRLRIFEHLSELNSRRYVSVKSNQSTQEVESSDLSPVEDKKSQSKQALLDAFPDYFSDGRLLSRIAHADFVDAVMARMDELGLSKNLEVYKELFRIFPPGMFKPKSRYDAMFMFNPSQQICCIRLLHKMEKNRVRPDKELELLILGAFGRHSSVWLKFARYLYWFQKGVYMDDRAIPEKLPEKPHELAKIALKRMTIDLNSIITVSNTKNLSDVVDKTWIVSCQSPLQRAIIEQLDENSILHVEDSGLMFVGGKYLTYFSLRRYTDEHKPSDNPKRRDICSDHNKLKFKFFGKPIKEKLFELNNMHKIANYHVLGIAITGTSSHDSLLSWIKQLQVDNPRLKKMNILFDVQRPTNDIVESATSN